jgi:hypothetical protein
MMAVNRGGGLATMLAIGLAVQGVTYLAAPVVVGIAESDLRRHVGELVEPADWRADPVLSGELHGSVEYAGWLHFQSGSAPPLPRLVGDRRSGPIFFAEGRPPRPGRPAWLRFLRGFR